MAAIHPERGRFILEDVHSRMYKDLGLVLYSPSITFQLSGPTVIKGSLPLDTIDLVQENIEAWACYLSYEENGTILASGILQPSDIDENGILSIEAEGPSAYAHGLPWMGDYQGVQVDPIDVVRMMWDRILTRYFGDIHIIVDQDTVTNVRIGHEKPPANDTGAESTGNLYGGYNPGNDTPSAGASGSIATGQGPYKLSWWEFTDMGQEIDNLAKNTPFDYVERFSWSDDKSKILKYIDFGYPRIGRKRTDLGFRGGENIVSAIPVMETNGQYANQIIVSGAGQGRNMVWDQASDTPPEGRVHRVKVINDKSLKSRADCKALAQRVLQSSLLPHSVDRIIVDGTHPNAPFGSFQCGDDILVQGDLPWIGEIAIWHRIVSYEYDVETSQCTLKLMRSDSFRYGYHGDSNIKIDNGGPAEFVWYDVDADTGVEAMNASRSVAASRNDVYQQVAKPNYGFDMSKSTTAMRMFQNWATLQKIDIRDTGSLSNTSYMFNGCAHLIEAPSMDLSNVTDASHMFKNCFTLTSIPAYDVSSVNDFTGMFDRCTSLKSIHMTGATASLNLRDTTMNGNALNTLFTNLGTAQPGATIDVTGLAGASQCSPSIAVSKGWSLIGVPFDWIQISGTGGNQSSIQVRNAAGAHGTDYRNAVEIYYGFDLSNATTAFELMAGWNSLESVKIRDTGNVLDARRMFYGCSQLQQVPAGVSTGSVFSMDSMFEGCSSLTTIPALDAKNVTSMSKTFDGCTSVTSVLMQNIGTTFSIADTLLNKLDLEALYTNLDTVPSGTVIDVTGVPGAPYADSSIAEAKGWTVSQTTTNSVADNFNRPNGSLGRNWVTSGYSPVIRNDRAHSAEGSQGKGRCYWQRQLLSDDMSVKVTVELIGGGSAAGGIDLGVDPTLDSGDWKNYVRFSFNDDNWWLYKRDDGGSRVTVDSGSWNLNANDDVTMTRSGSSVVVKKNNGTVTSRTVSISDGVGRRYVGMHFSVGYSWPFYYYSPSFDTFRAD